MYIPKDTMYLQETTIKTFLRGPYMSTCRSFPHFAVIIHRFQCHFQKPYNFSCHVIELCIRFRMKLSRLEITNNQHGSQGATIDYNRCQHPLHIDHRIALYTCIIQFRLYYLLALFYKKCLCPCE